VTVYRIGPNWYKSMVTIGTTKHTFFGYTREEVAGRAKQDCKEGDARCLISYSNLTAE
jgi:hypothetical protein